MAKPEIPICEAGVEDAATIARLLHDFNTEFEAETPGVEALTRHARRMLEQGTMTVLLGGEGPDGLALLEAVIAASRKAGAAWIELNTAEADRAARALYAKLGFTNEEGPEGATMLYYELELDDL